MVINESDQTVESPTQGGTASGWLNHNLTRRLLVAIPAVLLLFMLVVYLPGVFLAGFLLIVAGYGYYEYLQFTGVATPSRYRNWVVFASATVPIVGAFVGGLPGLSLGLGAGWIVVIAALMFDDSHDALRNTGLGSLGLLLVPWSLAHVVLMMAMPQGRGVIAWLVICLTLSDTFAYFAGTLLGKHPLWPKVSPSKTIEGAVAGLFGGLIGGGLSVAWLTGGPLNLNELALMLVGLGIAAVGQLGDLTESRLKRLCRVKDSGTLLPGHGGLLDRLDAYIFAPPLLYYYIVLIHA